jgi:hypothetical protein
LDEVEHLCTERETGTRRLEDSDPLELKVVFESKQREWTTPIPLGLLRLPAAQNCLPYMIYPSVSLYNATKR